MYHTSDGKEGQQRSQHARHCRHRRVFSLLYRTRFLGGGLCPRFRRFRRTRVVLPKVENVFVPSVLISIALAISPRTGQDRSSVDENASFIIASSCITFRSFRVFVATPRGGERRFREEKKFPSSVPIFLRIFCRFPDFLWFTDCLRPSSYCVEFSTPTDFVVTEICSS